jgi:repressor LexA
MLVYAMTLRPLSPKEIQALRYIRNRLVHGQVAPSVRELKDELKYRSPRSAAVILERLAAHGFIRRRPDGQLQLLRDLPEESSHARTVPVALVGLIACGAPLLAEQNIEAMIPVSVSLARPPHRYFMLRASGDSMNLSGIDDGDLVLVRQQPTAQDGDRVVALIDDEATIKVLRRAGDAIALEPRSKNKRHKPILVTRDFQVQGIVVSAIRAPHPNRG